MKVNNKKGIQLNQAFAAFLTIVLIAVLVIIAFVLFTSLQTSLPDQGATKVNESITVSTSPTLGLRHKLLNSSDCNFESPSITFITNNASQLVQAANYSLNATFFINNVTSTVNYTGGNLTYTYTNGGQSCTAITDTSTQFTSYPALVGLVGTIVLLGIIIGVLVGSFAFRRSSAA